jgi:Plavaka transposase
MHLLTNHWQDEIAKDETTHGTMFVPVVAGSDKTTVSVATGHQEYHPVYMSLRNLSNIARRAHGNALLPVAFLPIPKSAIFFKNNLTLITNLPTWICSNKKALEKRKVSSILPADVPCLPGSNLSTA